ncbi:MAG: hypothetical protein AAGB04_03720 [Pseudomonadota bacterium]
MPLEPVSLRPTKFAATLAVLANARQLSDRQGRASVAGGVGNGSFYRVTHETAKAAGRHQLTGRRLPMPHPRNEIQLFTGWRRADSKWPGWDSSNRSSYAELDRHSGPMLPA